MTRVAFQPKARRDLSELADHIARHNLDAAIRFCLAVDGAILLIAEFPAAGTLRSFGQGIPPGLKSYPVKKFRDDLMFYMTADSGIEIVRILHGARNVEAMFDDL